MEQNILQKHKSERTLSVRIACSDIISDKIERGVFPHYATTEEVSKKIGLPQMIVNYEFGRLDGMGVAVCREGMNNFIIEIK